MATPTPQERGDLAAECEPLTSAEILYWAEFSCWTVLVLCPFLYWINGAAVSTDQFVVRTALVVMSLCGAIALRVMKILRTRMRNKLDVPQEEPRDE